MTNLPDSEYMPGARVRLGIMPELQGTVEGVHEDGTLHVLFDSGSHENVQPSEVSLGTLPAED